MNASERRMPMSDGPGIHVESCGCHIVIGRDDTELAFVEVGHEARAAVQEVLARAEAHRQALERIRSHGTWIDDETEACLLCGDDGDDCVYCIARDALRTQQ